MRTSIAVRRCAQGLLLRLGLLLVFLVTTSADVRAQDIAGACAPAIGRVVSLQGKVDVQRGGTRDWLRIARLDTPVCTGDRVRTAPLSRAAFFLQPETLIRVDQNTTIAVGHTTTEVVVEFFQDDVAQEAREVQSCGTGYFITRFPKKRFRVSTPHVNAGVEGTEFEVKVRCESTELTVVEGDVRSQATPALREEVLSAGQMLVAGRATPLAVTTVIRPVDAVQWALYYPPLSDAKAEADIASAEQCRVLPRPAAQSCFTQRAETLLRLGRSDEALRSVGDTLALESANSDANALRAIIQIAKNDRTAALASAKAATDAAPNNYRAWLAHSYAQQSAFDLEQALTSAQKARALESAAPWSTHAWPNCCCRLDRSARRRGMRMRRCKLTQSRAELTVCSVLFTSPRSTSGLRAPTSRLRSSTCSTRCPDSASDSRSSVTGASLKAANNSRLRLRSSSQCFAAQLHRQGVLRREHQRARRTRHNPVRHSEAARPQ